MMSSPKRRSKVLRSILILACVFIIIDTIPLFVDVEPSKSDCQTNDYSLLQARPPFIVWGMSFNFETRFLKAFPVGSCEKPLIEWMDSMGFGQEFRSAMEGCSASAKEELARNAHRRETSNYLRARSLSVPAPIAKSNFCMSWQSSDNGRIEEIYVEAEHFHFFLP